MGARAAKRREQRDLARELAEFAGDALEWAELAMPAVLETWPGE